MIKRNETHYKTIGRVKSGFFFVIIIKKQKSGFFILFFCFVFKLKSGFN